MRVTCYNKLMEKRRTKSGFTLVELSFSILFIAILSLMIVAITLNLTSTYRRGLSLKQINMTGNDLIDDIRGTVSTSASQSLSNICNTVFNSDKNCIDDGAYSTAYVVRTANVVIGPKSSSRKELANVPVFGAFCTGDYSYIWNSGYFFSGDYEVGASSAKVIYSKTDAHDKNTLENFRLLKIKDPSRAICLVKANNGGKYTKNSSMAKDMSNEFNIASEEYPYVSEEPVDLLQNDEGYNDLALYDFTIERPAQDKSSHNSFYSGSFILATISGGINIMTSSNYCATPDEYDIENFDYCAINKFNFAIQANGE